jgi:hypothetical protein
MHPQAIAGNDKGTQNPREHAQGTIVTDGIHEGQQHLADECAIADGQIERRTDSAKVPEGLLPQNHPAGLSLQRKVNQCLSQERDGR